MNNFSSMSDKSAFSVVAASHDNIFKDMEKIEEIASQNNLSDILEIINKD